MATISEEDVHRQVAILRDTFAQYPDKVLIYSVPDFPKKGILFFDCLPIFESPHTFNMLLDIFASHIGPLKPTVVVGLDARGFIFAPALALRLNCRFIPVRKRGKLPGETIAAEYVKEYGADIFEMQKGKMNDSDRVVVVDDLIATGGSAKATGKMVREQGAQLLEYAFIMELTFLEGWKAVDAPVWRMVTENAGTKAGYANAD